MAGGHRGVGIQDRRSAEGCQHALRLGEFPGVVPDDGLGGLSGRSLLHPGGDRETELLELAVCWVVTLL